MNNREKCKHLPLNSSVRRVRENSTGRNHGQLPTARQLRRVSAGGKRTGIHREGLQRDGEFRNREGRW